MQTGTIAVVDYGMGNIHSMIKALRLYHPDVIFTADHAALSRAKALVLPGDGAFGAAMTHLKESGLDDVIGEHVEKERPLLGVCIGFQVLFTDSSETHGDEGVIAGLGLVDGVVRRFSFSDPAVRVPHMGWNEIEPTAGESHYMYFIHSYRAEGVPAEVIDSTCDYAGERFVASVRKGSVYATQFHPEKSDKNGLALLEAWVGSL